MPSDFTKPTRWRPRFSVRTLAIVVTLVCAYFGCWELTRSAAKAQIDEDTLDRFVDATVEETRDGAVARVNYDAVASTEPERIWMVLESDAPCPFVIWVREELWPPAPAIGAEYLYFDTYYAWFFGAKMKLSGPGWAYAVPAQGDPLSDDPFAELP